MLKTTVEIWSVVYTRADEPPILTSWPSYPVGWAKLLDQLKDITGLPITTQDEAGHAFDVLRDAGQGLYLRMTQVELAFDLTLTLSQPKGSI